MNDHSSSTDANPFSNDSDANPFNNDSEAGTFEGANGDLDRKPQSWVRFEEDKSGAEDVATIVPTQTIQVDSSHTLSHPLSDVAVESHSPQLGLAAAAAVGTGRVSPLSASIPTRPPRQVSEDGMVASRSSCPPDISGDKTKNLHTVPLTEGTIPLQKQTNSHGISHGFSNGDVVVNLLPINESCPWVTKATFKPELVPEELMAQGLTLTVEDYVMAMQVLVNDVRFNMYIICYKRVLIMWIVLGFVILLSLLFSGVRGLALFGGGIVWLIVNAVGIFVCMWLKVKLYRMLEQCMASVNALLYKHRILIGLDDRGKLSCHKVTLIFVYFDVSYCIKYLKDMLENEEKIDIQTLENTPAEPRATQTPIDQSRMDIDTSDIIITGSSTTRVSQKEKYAERLFLRYSQRWVKEYVRKRLDLRIPLHPDGTEEAGTPLPPRHCSSARCPCQFIEEHLRFKPLSKCSIREVFS